MINVISLTGNILLLTSLILGLLAIILPNRTRIFCFHGASILPLFALLLLIYAFLTSDFSIKNVFFNSSSLLPKIYKLSACWASHEGSILLWYSFLCIAGWLYIITANFLEKTKELAISILSFIQILFCSFIIFTSNPFDSLSFKPEEGLGLTPMLQDIALVIHPPILYSGTVSFIAPFIGGILLLFKPLEKEKILSSIRIFLNFALAMLTIGISLGAWWAYRELGWGGYWFFDPVENISLLPWICGIALHHFILLSIRKQQYLGWTISLAISSFLLTIYGTFVVRSGIISSVHAFAFSPERGFYILFICIILTILSLVALFLKRHNIKILQKNSSDNFNLQSSVILFGNLLWIISLMTLIISLIYPMYCFLIHDLDVIIDPEYFKKIYVPIHIPILILSAIAPSLVICANKRKILILCIALTIWLLISISCNFNFITQFFLFSSIYLILQTFDYLLVISEGFCKKITTRSYALFCGHLGLGLLVLSITLNTALTKEINFIGREGASINDNNFIVKLENIKFADGINYYRQIAEFSVKYQNTIIALKPENRLYKIENTLSQEVDIYSYLFYDMYAVLSQVSKKQIITAKIYYQPFINFIWLSAMIMALGFVLSLIKKDKNKI